MANTYTLLSSVTVSSGSSVSSIDFTNIPNDYSNLLVLASARSSRASNTADGLDMYLVTSGGVISSSYLYRGVQVGGGSIYNTSTSYEQGWGGSAPASSATASTFSNSSFYIPNYAGSNQKTYAVDSTAENNATEGWVSMNHGVNSTTSAITGLRFFCGNGNLMPYSSFYLYGIKNS